MLYSPYQLLALPELDATLARQTFHKRGERIIARMPKPGQLLLDRMERFRKLAIVLTAVEPCYLPNLDPEFIQLSNMPDIADCAQYRTSFDPVRTQAWLSCPTEQMRKDAEFLLLMRAHRRDPVGDDWSQLMRRAPAKSRKYLKDAALIAMDDRIAAEILLRFYEDLALRGLVGLIIEGQVRDVAVAAHHRQDALGPPEQLDAVTARQRHAEQLGLLGHGLVPSLVLLPRGPLYCCHAGLNTVPTSKIPRAGR